MVSLPKEFARVLLAHCYCHNTGHILCICIYLYEYSHVAVGHTKKNKSSAVAEMGDRLAIIHMSQKLGVAVPLSRGQLDPPSNTMPPRPMTISTPSGILIYPAIWPQHTWTDN